MHFFSAWMSGNQSWFKSFLLHELNFKVVNFPCLHSSMKYTIHVQTIHNVLAGKQVVRRLRRMYGFFPAFFFFLWFAGFIVESNCDWYLRDFTKYFKRLFQLWGLDIWTQVTNKYVKVFYNRKIWIWCITWFLC